MQRCTGRGRARDDRGPCAREEVINNHACIHAIRVVGDMEHEQRVTLRAARVAVKQLAQYHAAYTYLSVTKRSGPMEHTEASEPYSASVSRHSLVSTRTYHWGSTEGDSVSKIAGKYSI